MSTGNLTAVTVAKRLVSASVSKALSAAVAVGRFIKEVSFVNTAAFTDTTSFAVGSNPIDSGNFSGEPVVSRASILADSLGFSDAPAFGIFPVLADGIGVSDSGQIIAQDYCDISYFASDYVGTKHTI
jgi:hypothetical protein